MTKAHVRAAVVKVLLAIQALSGRQAVPTIADDTKPIGDLEGFDSLSGLEATMMLEAELGCTFGDTENVFLNISPSGKKRPLRVSETVQRITLRMVSAA